MKRPAAAGMWCRVAAERWCAASALAAALLFRWAYASRAYASTFDSATVGLMAIHILRHGERPVFFYGQNYFGSLDAWLAAGLFALFGVSEVALAMAAILPSLLWIAATWLLFRQWRGPAAGCAAAWTLAVPGWIVLHYSTGTYGGYPIAFALGTLVLWLALRVWDRNPDGLALLREAAPMALAAGLAFWTHLISTAWLLPAAVLVVAHLGRRKFRWPAVWPFAASAPIWLAAASPLIWGRDPLTISHEVARWNLSPRLIFLNLVGLWGRLLRQHLFVEGLPPTAHWIPMGLCVVSVVLCAAAVAQSPRGDRCRMAWPWVACALFLALYLPHGMAALQAPRYTIPLRNMALATLAATPVAVSDRRLRVAGIATVVGWTLYYGIADAKAIRAVWPERAAQIEDRAAIAAAAESAGLRSAVVIGSDLTGHEGQIYSFASEGRIAFVNAYGERHRPSAELAERDDRCGWLTHGRHSALVETALRDLGAVWREMVAGGHTLWHDIRVDLMGGQGVAPSRMQLLEPAEVPKDAVSDRCGETWVEGSDGSPAALVIDLDRPVRLAAVHLVSPDALGEGLPRDVRILGSPDGVTYVELRPASPRVAAVWTAGPRAWFGGHGGHMECRVPPREVRRIRLEPHGGRAEGRHGAWRIAEVYLREASDDASPPAPTSSEVVAMATGAVFVAADRWVSAHLGASQPQGTPPRVFPRANYRYRDTLLDRELVPRPGLAIAVARPWRDETAEILSDAAPGSVWERSEHGAYTLFCCVQAGEAASGRGATLYWQGSFLWRRGPGATAAK